MSNVRGSLSSHRPGAPASHQLLLAPQTMRQNPDSSFAVLGSCIRVRTAAPLPSAGFVTGLFIIKLVHVVLLCDPLDQL